MPGTSRSEIVGEEEVDNQMNPNTPPQRSYATTNTVSESLLSRRSEVSEQHQECQAEGIYLEKRRDRTLTTWACMIGNDVLSNSGLRRPTVRHGKTNQFGGCERIRLCSDHAEKYDGWMMAQKCTAHGCPNVKSGTVLNGTISKVRMALVETASYASGTQKEHKEE